MFVYCLSKLTNNNLKTKPISTTNLIQKIFKSHSKARKQIFYSVLVVDKTLYSRFWKYQFSTDHFHWRTTHLWNVSSEVLRMEHPNPFENQIHSESKIPFLLFPNTLWTRPLVLNNYESKLKLLLPSDSGEKRRFNLSAVYLQHLHK